MGLAVHGGRRLHHFLFPSANKKRAYVRFCSPCGLIHSIAVIRPHNLMDQRCCIRDIGGATLHLRVAVLDMCGGDKNEILKSMQKFGTPKEDAYRRDLTINSKTRFEGRKNSDSTSSQENLF